MSSTSAKRSTRLASEDWTDAALEVLRTQGRAGITINTLCDHLGVTRGSFYWHFADLDDAQGSRHRALVRRHRRGCSRRWECCSSCRRSSECGR